MARHRQAFAVGALTGADVTVLTGMPNHPSGVVPPAYRRRARVREHTDGYDVVRTWLYATPNEGMARKTLGHLSFMVSSVVLGWRARGPAYFAGHGATGVFLSPLFGVRRHTNTEQ
ncbi:MAG: hypothetical protein ACYC1D_15930 [Acidimicrobiales bacterium]